MADVREIVATQCFCVRTGAPPDWFEDDATKTERMRALMDADAILSALSSAGFAVFKLGDIKLIQSQCGIPDAGDACRAVLKTTDRMLAAASPMQAPSE